ncbi:MAG: hypothetical protein J6Y02_03720 [Pseudobutyrivibrio sp.]|nr:hypothetical protein [Pseudobutyrivibrio sp.]
MSKVIKNKGGIGVGAPYELPGYEYDPVNDVFKDLETGKIFTKDGGTTDETIESNKVTSIDVSQYAAPIEIKPTIGNDAMKKATVTLSNIPQASDIEVNKAETIDVSQYTEPVEITPTSGKDGMAKATVTLNINPETLITKLYAWRNASDGKTLYTLTDSPTTGSRCFTASGNSTFPYTLVKKTISDVGDDYIASSYWVNGAQFTRYSTGDISF